MNNDIFSGSFDPLPLCHQFYNISLFSNVKTQDRQVNDCSLQLYRMCTRPNPITRAFKWIQNIKYWLLKNIMNTYQSCPLRPLIDISPNMIWQIYFWNFNIWIRWTNDELFIFSWDLGKFVFPINWTGTEISIESCEIKLSNCKKWYFLKAGK